jgi:hypothetical protein
VYFGDSLTFWRNISPPSSGSKLRMLPISVGFLLGFLFDPEDGNNMFFRNKGLFCPEYTVLQHRRPYSSESRHENLKTNLKITIIYVTYFYLEVHLMKIGLHFRCFSKEGFKIT